MFMDAKSKRACAGKSRVTSVGMTQFFVWWRTYGAQERASLKTAAT
jgi:hypothetical protein